MTILGGSAGIGRAVALALSENGAVVTVLARRKDRLDAVVEQLHEVPACLRADWHTCKYRADGIVPVSGWCLCLLANLCIAQCSCSLCEDTKSSACRPMVICDWQNTRTKHVTPCHTSVFSRELTVQSSNCDPNPALLVPTGARCTRLMAWYSLAQGYGVVADLVQLDEVEGAVQEASSKMGGLDILVNNGA